MSMNVFLIMVLSIIVVCSALIFRLKLSDSGNKGTKPVFVQSFGLGTVIQMSLYGKNSNAAIEKAIEKIGDIDDKMSYYKEESDISRINRNAGGEFQKVSEETYYVIKKAVEYSALSKGAIDLTVRPMTDLWKIGSENPQFPAEEEIKRALELVNYEDIEFNECDGSIRLKYKDQAIDVNAIAKGFAADEVKRIVEGYGVKSAVINLGGNVVVVGSKTDGSSWKIGVQHPIKERGNYIGFLDVKDKSVVTSGDYEKFFMYNNEKYHHTIDPKTGYPVKNRIVSTTIISDLSIDGDALTTCLYVLGIKEGLEFINSFKAIDAIIITEDKKVYATENIKSRFSITDMEYVVC